ncbi:MAG: S4 domain-containing protein, partial [Porticoccaceae bacterium]
MNDPGGIRISKLMAERGLCSRREADAYIERGLVFVNGERVTQLGTRAAPDAVITLGAQAQASQARQVTILLHKPIGYVSGQAEDGHQPAVTLISAQTQASGDKQRFQ